MYRFTAYALFIFLAIVPLSYGLAADCVLAPEKPAVDNGHVPPICPATSMTVGAPSGGKSCPGTDEEKCKAAMIDELLTGLKLRGDCFKANSGKPCPLCAKPKKDGQCRSTGGASITDDDRSRLKQQIRCLHGVPPIYCAWTGDTKGEGDRFKLFCEQECGAASSAPSKPASSGPAAQPNY